MAYPETWTCPSCGAVVYNSPKCTTCNYQPPQESGSLQVKGEVAPKGRVDTLLKERILAFLIDMGILLVMGGVIGLIIALTLGTGSNKGLDVLFPLFGIPTILLFGFIHPIYFLVLEGLYAQTYGKKIMKIKVSVDGGMTISKGVTRNITRFIEMIPLYIPSIIMVRKDGRRLGDRLAKTVVIKLT